MDAFKAVKASRPWRRAVLLSGIGIVSAASVAGVSYGLTSATTSATAKPSVNLSATSTKAAPKVQAPYAKARAVLRRAVSGQIELYTKKYGFVTIDFDRGSVSSISRSAVTVLRPDGRSITEAVGSSTHMPKSGAPDQGQNVIVVSHAGKALYIFDVGPFAGQKGSGSSSSTATS
jgi:hypothetical protein